MRIWAEDCQKNRLGEDFQRIKEEVNRGRTCLFVLDDEGRHCNKAATNRCHVIPKSSVLDHLVDDTPGRVLELRWGLNNWEHLFVSSSKDKPVDLDDTDIFAPQLARIRDACVGRFACQTDGCDTSKSIGHDGVFGPIIDVTDPDPMDPIVSIMTMYRAVLYAADLTRVGRHLVKKWNRRAWNDPSRELRINWARYSKILKDGYPDVLASVKRLGKMWYRYKTHGVLEPDAVSGQSMRFRSRLKFAACVFYGKCVVTVFPVSEHRHKLNVFHFAEDADSVQESKELLVRRTIASEESCNYGVGVLKALTTNVGGVVAASHRSYYALADDEKQTIGQIVSDTSYVKTMAMALSSQAKPSCSRRRSR